MRQFPFLSYLGHVFINADQKFSPDAVVLIHFGRDVLVPRFQILPNEGFDECGQLMTIRPGFVQDGSELRISNGEIDHAANDVFTMRASYVPSILEGTLWRHCVAGVILVSNQRGCFIDDANPEGLLQGLNASPYWADSCFEIEL